MTIMIIDDEIDVRRVLGMRLQAEGFAIDAVDSAGSAFRHLHEWATRAGSESVDLILMDLLMPDMSGIEACRRLKDDPAAEDIPVIIMTASHDARHIQQAFTAGAADYLTKPFSRVELLARIGAALRIKSQLDRHRRNERQLQLATEKLQTVNVNLERLSALDGLTGLYNRRYFDEMLAREYRRAIRSQSSLALIMADIDWFKLFNDRYGHLVGDECLRRVARVFGRLAHRSHDMVARYGGEEFAVILPDTALPGALELAEALRCQVEALRIDEAQDAPSGNLTLSLGAACVIPQAGTRPQELLRRADQALYRSKKAGRNRVTAASPFLQH